MPRNNDIGAKLINSAWNPIIMIEWPIKPAISLVNPHLNYGVTLYLGIKITQKRTVGKYNVHTSIKTFGLRLHNEFELAKILQPIPKCTTELKFQIFHYQFKQYFI